MTTSDDEEQTCGEELAAAAEVHEKWRELMLHVAGNLTSHSAWVGTGSEAARREHLALLEVAREYHAMADAGGRAAAAMRAMEDLPPAPHDPAKIDHRAQARWMRTKIAMQREFAALLTRHAEESERALAQLEDAD
jgi:hypothetical protein